MAIAEDTPIMVRTTQTAGFVPTTWGILDPGSRAFLEDGLAEEETPFVVDYRGGSLLPADGRLAPKPKTTVLASDKALLIYERKKRRDPWKTSRYSWEKVTDLRPTGVGGIFTPHLEFTFEDSATGVKSDAFWPIALRLPQVARTVIVQHDELAAASSDDLEEFEFGCRAEVVLYGQHVGAGGRARYERFSIAVLSAKRGEPEPVYQVFSCPRCSGILVIDIGSGLGRRPTGLGPGGTAQLCWISKGGEELVQCDSPFEEQPGGLLVEAQFPPHMSASDLSKRGAHLEAEPS